MGFDLYSALENNSPWISWILQIYMQGLCVSHCVPDAQVSCVCIHRSPWRPFSSLWTIRGLTLYLLLSVDVPNARNDLDPFCGFCPIWEHDFPGLPGRIADRVPSGSPIPLILGQGRVRISLDWEPPFSSALMYSHLFTISSCWIRPIFFLGCERTSCYGMSTVEKMQSWTL